MRQKVTSPIPGARRDPNSNALIFSPSSEDTRINKLRNIVVSILREPEMGEQRRLELLNKLESI